MLGSGESCLILLPISSPSACSGALGKEAPSPESRAGDLWEGIGQDWISGAHVREHASTCFGNCSAHAGVYEERAQDSQLRLSCLILEPRGTTGVPQNSLQQGGQG